MQSKWELFNKQIMVEIIVLKQYINTICKIDEIP
jgi:hypothetical protein